MCRRDGCDCDSGGLDALEGLSMPVAIWRCCRDWPLYPLLPVGRCGLCGERPEPTGKTLATYMAERAGGYEDEAL